MVETLRDVLGVLGYLLVVVGVLLVSVPAGLIVAGLVPLAVAIWPSVRPRQEVR